jgi:hypothetical protein
LSACPVLLFRDIENTEETSGTINVGSKKDKKNFVPHNMVPHTTFDKRYPGDWTGLPIQHFASVN